MLDVKTVSRGACFADYDNDGKVDAFVVNLGAPATLLHNVSAEQQSLAHGEVEREEEQSRWHRSAPGIARAGEKQMAERIAGSGYLSQDDGRVHFGLGARRTKSRNSPCAGRAAKSRFSKTLPRIAVLTVEEP